MAISIRAAYKNITSDAYNKQNVGIFLIISLISGLFCALSGGKIITSMGLSAIFGIIYGLILIFSGGISALAVWNFYNNSEKVFPDIFKDFKQILTIALKVFAGSLSIGIIIGCIVSLFILITSKILPILSIIIIVVFALTYLFLVTALYASFLSSLKFADWFKFGRAFDLIQKHFVQFCKYYFKCLIIGILALIIVLILSVILGIILGLIHLASTPVITLAGNLFGGLLGGFVILFVIDIAGQFLKEIMPK